MLYNAQNIRGFQKFSLCDWPGTPSSVLFFEGCNLACPTCHNAGLLTPDAGAPKIGPSIQDYLVKFRSWIDGVVLTGGEPTIQPNLSGIVRELGKIGFAVNLNTNGLRPDVVRDLAHEVTLFAVDVKGPWEKYPALTGVCSPDRARDALSQVFQIAAARPEQFYFRTTVVPGLTEEDLAECRSYLPAGCILHLQEFREPIHSPAKATDQAAA